MKINSIKHVKHVYIKYEFMDQMVNNIQLTWKSALMLKTYRIYNSTVRFSKYELYNKLLGCVTLFRVTLGITWTQPIYIHTHI